MAIPKRKSEVLDSATCLVEDKDTDIAAGQISEEESEDEGSDDSSVYSELEEEEEEDSSDEGDDEEEEDSSDEGDDDEEDKEEEKDDAKEDKEVVGSELKTSKKGPKEKVNREQKGDKEKKVRSATETLNEARKVHFPGPQDADEYAYDSSDEEDIRNTIGNVPVNWYDDHEHLGYDLDGRRIRKPKRGDELEHFLRMREGGEDAGFTVRDPATGQDVVLSRKQVEAIRYNRR